MIKKCATTAMLYCLLVFPPLAFSAADAILEQVRQHLTQKGLEHARATARGFGIRLREQGGTTRVPIVMKRQAFRGKGFAQKLSNTGAQVDAQSRDYLRLLVPLSRLSDFIGQFPDEPLLRPVPVPAWGAGNQVSESVELTAAHGYQLAGYRGNGVDVAVVDLGFTGLTNAINQGELPADTVSVDFTNTGLQTDTNHGTGVAEHVVDMAPGVRLHCIKVADLVDLQNALDYIRTNNIKIANHSVTWAIASYYDDTGPVNDLFNESVDVDGVFWAISSGNQARKHWRGTWLDTDGDNLHEFSAGDETLELLGSSGTVAVFLNWNQYGVGNKVDLSLEIINAAGAVVASSNINQSGSDPAEAVTFSYQSTEAPYSARVRRNRNNASGLDLTLFSFNHDFEYRVAAASLMDPASAHGPFTVGAVNKANWDNASPTIEGYSSRGPTTDGRLKPDLVAPDRTSSLTYPVASGTSFSAPTVAGAAALLLEEYGTLSPDLLRLLLVINAEDIGATGDDNTFGSGKLRLPPLDSDGDGLDNETEILLGTDPFVTDSDEDGLSDQEEVEIHGTDPLSMDSDSDGIRDYFEIYGGGLGHLAPRGAQDGIITFGDYVVLSQLVSGTLTPTVYEMESGDLNNNNQLDVGDLIFLMGFLESAP